MKYTHSVTYKIQAGLCNNAQCVPWQSNTLQTLFIMNSVNYSRCIITVAIKCHAFS